MLIKNSVLGYFPKCEEGQLSSIAKFWNTSFEILVTQYWSSWVKGLGKHTSSLEHEWMNWFRDLH